MSAERQIPGGPFLNETGSNEQQIPGGPFVNETVSGTTNTNVNAASGSLTVSGYAPTVTAPVSITAGTGSVVLTGQVPSVSTTASIDVSTSSGLLSVTGQSPSVTEQIGVSSEVGTLAVTGQSPTVTQQLGVLASTGTLSVTGNAPSVTTQITANTGETTLSISGQAPTVSQQINVPASTGTLAVTGITPTASVINYAYLNASADVTDGSWVKSTDGTNADLYTMLDETTIDDADYIKTSVLDDECEIRLASGNVPSVSGYTNLLIKVPPGFSPTGTLTVTLVDNVTQVQQWASQSVSAGQLLDLAVTETISSYTNLRVRLKATA